MLSRKYCLNCDYELYPNISVLATAYMLQVSINFDNVSIMSCHKVSLRSLVILSTVSYLGDRLGT